MSYRLNNDDDEWVRAMMGTGCLATIGTEGRTTDGADQSRERSRSWSTHKRDHVPVKRVNEEKRRLGSATALTGFSHHTDLKEKPYGDQRRC